MVLQNIRITYIGLWFFKFYATCEITTLDFWEVILASSTEDILSRI